MTEILLLIIIVILARIGTLLADIREYQEWQKDARMVRARLRNEDRW